MNDPWEPPVPLFGPDRAFMEIPHFKTKECLRSKLHAATTV